MAYQRNESEGSDPGFATNLSTVDITNTRHLLAKCASSAGRKSTAEKTGLTEAQLLKWANMADLMRISGVGEEYSELLEAAGVDTVKELRNRRPDNLAAKMVEVNTAKKLVRQTPSETQVTKWVEQAKSLDPLITH